MSVREFAKMKNESIRAVIHKAEEGGYWATIPAFPGCVTEGDTLEETEANIREAAEVWLYTKLQSSLRAWRRLRPGKFTDDPLTPNGRRRREESRAGAQCGRGHAFGRRPSDRTGLAKSWKP